MKILVADDSKTNLALITKSLQNLGHEVMAATHGEQAVEMFQVSRPDLIILDVVMEGMSGFECAKGIRAISEGDWIPIIFLSGSVDDSSIAQGIDAGGDDYLTKPFSEIKLAAKIKAMQRISSMRKELFEATQQLTTLSSTDTLTGVYNRLQFNKIIKEKIAQSDRQNCMFALLFLDLDKFKTINDTQGHHAGDLLLIEVTQRLQSCLRINDFLARMGGDEFAIILSDLENPETVKTVSQKIIDVLALPYTIEGHVVQTSTSIGVVFYPLDGMDPEVLSKNADIAMYYAKKSGRNNYQYFTKEILEESKRERPLQIIPESPEIMMNEMSVLHCNVNGTLVCIDLRFIKKSLPLPQLAPLPNGPDYLVGLMNLAGKSIPVVDLGIRLNLPRTQSYSLETPVLLCGDDNNEVAFIVDKIVGLHEINQEQLQTQGHANKPDSLFIATTRVGADLSLLVNMKYLCAAESLEFELDRKRIEVEK